MGFCRKTLVQPRLHPALVKTSWKLHENCTRMQPSMIAHTTFSESLSHSSNIPYGQTSLVYCFIDISFEGIHIDSITLLGRVFHTALTWCPKLYFHWSVLARSWYSALEYLPSLPVTFLDSFNLGHKFLACFSLSILYTVIISPVIRLNLSVGKFNNLILSL